jgi:hypothetical protein
LKLHAVIGCQKKANVIASHAFNMTQSEAVGNLMSGGEH